MLAKSFSATIEETPDRRRGRRFSFTLLAPTKQYVEISKAFWYRKPELKNGNVHSTETARTIPEELITYIIKEARGFLIHNV